MDHQGRFTLVDLYRPASTIDTRVYFANLGYDTSLVRKMNQFYLKYLYQMKDALGEANRNGISAEAKFLLHKLKATYGVFGMRREYELIEQLELSLNEIPYTDKVKKMEQIMNGIGNLIYDLEMMCENAEYGATSK